MQGVVMSSEEFSRMLGSGQPLEPTRILDEARIMRLREVAKLRSSACVLKVGDVVTARQEGPIIGHGEPMLVVEAQAFGLVVPANDIHVKPFLRGERMDVAVLRMHAEEDFSLMVGPHWWFELWAGGADLEREVQEAAAEG